MTTAVQHRRGTTAEHSTFTGLEGEVTIDTTKDTAVIHDGSLAGGYPLAKETLANVNPSTLSAITGAATASDDLFLMYDTSALAMKKISRAELNNAITIEALDNVDINGGTIDGTTIGGTTAAAGTFTTLTANTSLTAATADINGGTIDGSAIGGTTPAAGSFTTLAASGAVTLSGGTANGVAYLNGSKVLTSGSALTFDGTNFGVGGTANTYSGYTNLTLNNAVNGPIFDLNYAGTRQATFLALSNEARIGSISNIPFTFYCNGSEGMRLTSTGLGIGTSSPVTRLSVSTSAGPVANFNSTNANGGYIRFEINGTASGDVGQGSQIVSGGGLNNFGINVRGANSLLFATNTVERARIDSSGNLGLGVTPSAWNGLKSVQVGPGAAFSGGTSFSDAFVSANAYYNGTSWIRIGANAAAMYAVGALGTHIWNTAPSGTAGAAISFTQAMTLDASGNLRVGTTSGGYSGLTVTSTGTSYLSVYGATAGSSEGGVLIGGGGAENQGNFVYNAGSNYAQLGVNPAGSYLLFSVAGAERARIDSSGDLLVGTTSNGFGGLFSTKFNLDAVGSSGIGVKINSVSSSYGLAIWNAATSGQRLIGFYAGSSITSVGSIESNGTTTSYNTSSDYRLKEDIQPMSDATSRVLALNPVNFAWKVDGKRVDGFLAHELAEVVPEAVTGEKDAVDADGNPVYQGIDQSKLLPVVVAALQEALARIETLEAQINGV